MSADAASNVTPGRSRPIAESCCPSPRFSASGSSCSGIQSCELLGRANRSGITPTMVNGCPFTRSCRPTTFGSPPKRSCQVRWASTTTRSPPGRSSPSRMPRPRMGDTPYTANVFAVTHAPVYRSARSVPLTFAVPLKKPASDSKERCRAR